MFIVPKKAEKSASVVPIVKPAAWGKKTVVAVVSTSNYINKKMW
jgi:hypothetical protein